MKRMASIERNTIETKIKASLSIDGAGQSSVATGIGFFDHMLILFARHGLFDLTMEIDGDFNVDGHHSVEDAGIVLGKALAKALGDRAGIKRYGTAFVPMDEALAMVSLDISGRPYLVFEATMPSERVGQFESELVEEFLRAFATHAGLTLHVRLLSGKNTHHIIEAIFKGLGQALDEATRVDERIAGVMSTKGKLD
ncbi:MAG TPA: imidazoleglycerol-phosphate dehydratase HisB [Methylomusa anaerophila]|uniref:Imidazoleglycerol-phosphate dehydratase n=1 Tax=Methylomusa anaerophila TaxID=1930071 RepID=A0A348AMQ9_9FIRM|nr:imidazoleglycerol-phosphate dehydratase HisB [Methylomusa anaerophila]BBB92357.1 imidazoleglycerol-phosphate dehydratase [Methylomusa anaerophila]HML90004.1 imidazoleglycerol-phosphate dehydratase HisB [Methylomusa anaerophila]